MHYHFFSRSVHSWFDQYLALKLRVSDKDDPVRAAEAEHPTTKDKLHQLYEMDFLLWDIHCARKTPHALVVD